MCSADYLLQPRVARRRPKRRRWPRAGALWMAAAADSTAAKSVVVIILALLISAASASNSSSSIQFTQAEYKFTIPENSVGKVAALPSSSTRPGIELPGGPDDPVRIRFRIRSGDPDGLFKADAERVGDFVFLVIRTRTNSERVPNRERVAQYVLDVRPKGRRFDSARCKVIVEVTDTNDLDPFFQPSRYAFVVEEDTALHASLGRVRAEDADEGVNGEIYYSLVDPFSHPEFAVDPLTGVISLARPLKFAEHSLHSLTVLAQDRGAKPAYAVRQADTAVVSMEVKQVNLHDPLMKVRHLPEVIEQSHTDIYAIVSVVDPDPDPHGLVKSVEIIEGDSEAHFRVTRSPDDDNEFNIEVVRLLDREVSPYGYNLTLKAMDQGVPPRVSYKNVHVRLADVNDHAPLFDRQVYRIHVSENAPPGALLARLKVSDRDSGRNAKVRLSVDAGNGEGLFRLDSQTGAFYVAKPLDADGVGGRRKSAAVHTLAVSALDAANAGVRKQSSAKVRIIVDDVNDNDPDFGTDDITVDFDENQDSGTVVTRVEAKDADSGENGHVSYSLSNLQGQVPFEIDPFTGVVTSTRVLDYESDRRMYTLFVRASDWGTPFRRQTELRLHIKLVDVNDNRPQFERIDCSGQLGRDTPVGAEILTLSALDFDAKNLISYRVVSGNADGCFGLDPARGVLSVMCDLRTLPSLRRVINVTATDGEHFSDVSPITVHFTKGEPRPRGVFSARGVGDALFECKETGVAARLAAAMAQGKKNNEEKEDSQSPFGPLVANVHHPELDRIKMPREVRAKESLAPGSLILKVPAHDRDLGFNGALLYVISEGDVDSAFDLDMHSGRLTIGTFLDREATAEYLLNITVYDQGKPRKSDSRLLRVIVEDCNDNPPIFEKSSFSFFFLENTTPNTTVVTLKATDADEGVSGKVVYSLDTPTEDFEIDSHSGLLVTSGQLDRERKEFYDLRIRASDSDPLDPLSSVATVRVRIVDVNDVAPKFSSTQYVVKAREDLPVGAVVGSVNAHDPDLYQGGKIRFSLDGSKDFAIDDLTGCVRVASRLDYETRQLYNLTVRATDEGSPPLYSTSFFIVEVADVNENLHAPRFDTFFMSAAVPENKAPGAHVTKVEARDGDKGDDGRVTYSVHGGDGLGTFDIDDEGNIRTLAALDRESKAGYWLTIYAEDRGAVSLSARLHLYVEVLNVNDNAPLTKEPVYFPSVRENAKPFTHVLTIEAVDGDADAGGTKLSYEIIGGNPQSLFHIDPNAGVLSTTKRRLDRETQAEHVLEVRVSDNGKPPLNSTTRVVVTVTDENDNEPEFLERFYKVSIPEVFVEEAARLQNDQEAGVDGENASAALNDTEEEELYREWEELFVNNTWQSLDENHRGLASKAIFRPLAFDRDEGENGKLTYSMKVNDDSKLKIDPLTGIIFAMESLSAGEQHEMLVRVVDGGKKSSMSRVRMQVKATAAQSPTNKNPPKVLETTPAQVFESDEIGHLVSLVVAEDDDGDDLWYSIDSGNDNNAFYISPDRGSILLAQNLDWERKSSYNLTVRVTDGRHSTFTYVPVAIIDVNEGRPQFVTKEFNVEVPEDLSVGKKILMLNVTDGDRAGKISFSFHSAQDPSSMTKFALSPTSGVITLKESLDSERLVRHVLTVCAKDQGTPVRANFVRVLIHVRDRNDHAPHFLSKLMQVRLHETAEVGTEVTRVVAVDIDRGDNGRLGYAIAVGNAGDAFSIDEELGTLRVNRPLNMAVQSEYTLTVVASDHGDPPLSAMIPVHIVLIMSDEAPPRFTRPHYSTEVHENQPRGKFILQVFARASSALRFEITAGNDDSEFAINPSTGILMAQQTLDYEKKRFYNLSISASNMIGARAHCTAHVHVLDINDNAPRFENRSFMGRVSESASMSSLVLVAKSHSPLVIKASDADSGVNSLLHYEILEAKASKFFAVDESTGAIRTIATLDYEQQSSFVFNVRVSDRGTPKLSSEVTARVEIEVMDENDSPPRFDQREYEAVLLLPTFRGVVVTTVNASDPDKALEDPKGLSFLISGGDDAGTFAIDEDSGVVSVADEKDLVHGRSYSLDLTVTDGKFTDRCALRIRVRRADNSGLAFAHERYYAQVLENSTKSDVITVLTVLGASLNEDLRFSLLNPTDLFSIGETSGAVRTTGKVFDREKADRHEVVAEVFSQDHARTVPRVAHVVIEVTVLDINDNAPIFVGRPYHALLPADAEKDSVVIRVSAVDADTGTNGDIYYQLVRGNGELFRVGRKSGQITLRRPPPPDAPKEYKLTVAAYDGGTPPYQAEASVLIRVVDESVPVFAQHLYTTKVREDVKLYSPVVAVSADSPHLDGKLIYTLESGNDSGHFSVDHTSGVVSVTESLDFESKPHHQLTVRATDSLNGGFADALVLLGVEDVNDCRPEFESDAYRASVSEARPVLTPVLTVHATDADSGANGEVEYSIVKNVNNASLFFGVNSDTGEVFVKRKLDRERQQSHTFTVSATDKGPRPLTATVVVTIDVEDANDNSPAFEETDYSVKLSDRAHRGQFVTRVRAVDADDADKLSYAIAGGDDGQFFSMDTESGIISLVNLNGFDKRSLYILNVSVTDGVFASFARVRITLFSVNSFSPVFPDSTIDIAFPENRPEGSRVGRVVAQDEDRDDHVRYKIQSDVISTKFFRINPVTGELTSLMAFDREERAVYEVPVVATDTGGRNGFTTVKVQITDENDNSPEFALSEYKANIFANLTAESLVVKVSAVDADENARLAYSIYSENNSSTDVGRVFKINPTSGQIALRISPIALENQVYQFFVRASDGGGRHADAPVEVYIMSPLDRPPVFQKRGSVFYVPENSQAGELITHLVASDEDFDVETISYRIASSAYQHGDSPFAVGAADGRFIVNGLIDREKRALHRVTVVAETDSSPALVATYQLTVQVLDRNDHAPVFDSSPFEVSVSESVPTHTRLVQARATDEDFGSNGEIRYSLSSKSSHLSSLFTVDPYNGWVSLQGSLDREQKASYELEVVASDNGAPSSRSATTTVVIQVEDANDSPPEFSQLHYSAAVNEGALPGTIIFQLITEDKDEEATREVEFYIISGDDKGQFQVKQNGEMYVSHRLDRETRTSYRLEVAATDGVFVATCRVSIEILDDNDEPPVCLKSTHWVTIEENLAAGAYLLTVEASDADEGANARQVYYLTGDDADLFSIDRNSGSLHTSMPLDREKRNRFELEAHAQDAGMPEWECSTRVTIDLTDVNDNAPEWTQSVFSAALREDVPVGTVATKVTAMDPDLGENRRVTYVLMASAGGTFRIDETSGVVTLVKPLDREERAMYNLTVRAMDHGRPRLASTTSLLVMVLDVNDNPPEFASKLYFASVSESTDVGADVVRVLATSRDSGVNADITYSIVGGNQHRNFKIDPKSGVILLTGALDYEKTRDYFLTVQAMDGGDPPLSNRAMVNVSVHDANDNTPDFTQVSYSATVSESAPPGQGVVTVTATDADSGDNGKVSYAILSGDRHNQFAVDAISGRVTVASALDREMVSSYVLEVAAVDAGVPNALSATVLVDIDISDANDNPPIFPRGNYTAYAQEDKPLGHVLMRFDVTDADDAPNGGPFTFDIRSGNDDDAFRVDQDGSLRTADKLNHHIRNEYVLQVRVFDNGSPPLYSDSFVTVAVIEESKFPPAVVPFQAHVYSYQDDFPGAPLGKVEASDQDRYDQLRYALTQHQQSRGLLFEIDDDDGTVVALPGLDAGTYTLNISVTDGKFTTFSRGLVVVDAITDEMLDSAVIVRFANVSPRMFVHNHEAAFVKMIKAMMKVKSKDVIVLSAQPKVSKSYRTKREAKDDKMAEKETFGNGESKDLEVLFLVKDSKDSFYSRDKVRSALDWTKFSSLAADIGLRAIEVQSDECSQGDCGENGQCNDLVSMDDGSVISIDGFVAPHFKHEKACQCDEGFAGDSCQVVLNECARKPCPNFKTCVPDSSFQGYQCRCPEGLTGVLCNVNVTDCQGGKDGLCGIVNPMTFGGKSYAQYELLRSPERHLSLSLSLRTLHTTGNLMYVVGRVDYSILELVNGALRFRFNFGSGEGAVTLNQGGPINDGRWHRVELERHGNSARLSLDGGAQEAQGAAPGANDVLNLGTDGNDIYFGAEVTVHLTPENGEDVSNGFVGCLDDLRLDGAPLPLHLHGSTGGVGRLKRFHNVEFKCDSELQPPGVCGSHPCHNGGTCQEQSGGYVCACLSRFSGTHCEYDLDPCASNPCLFGGECVNLKNDFRCLCPAKLSGKRCHYGKFCNPNPCRNGGVCEEGDDAPICQCRGFTGERCTVDINECLHQNPCRNGGTCINTEGSFSCTCAEGVGGPYCGEVNIGVVADPRNYRLTLEELVAVIASLFLIVLIVTCYVLCKRIKVKQRSGGGRGAASYHIQNDFDKQETVLLNHGNKREQKLNNLELAAQERPLITPPRPMSCYAQQQQETAFNYVDTVRSYGSAADELEALPRISQDYIQNIQKPMAAVAPSVCTNPVEQQSTAAVDGACANSVTVGAGVATDRNLMDNYFYPQKPKTEAAGGAFRRLRVNLPPTESPGLKGAAATSLNSLPTSVAEDSCQRYYWDSFDLNNQQANSSSNSNASHQPLLLPKLVEDSLPATNDGSATHTSTLPPPGRPVDPTRDIETLNEDDVQSNAAISTADTEDEPQLGAVFPPQEQSQQPLTKSFEELLALHDDINFADEEDENSSRSQEQQQRPFDFHLNNYLPTYNVSETDTDEQTPMMGRHSLAGNDDVNNSSELNGSIAALPEGHPVVSSTPLKSNQGELDNVCELEDSDEETPTVEVKPMRPMNPRVTRV